MVFCGHKIRKEASGNTVTTTKISGRRDKGRLTKLMLDGLRMAGRNISTRTDPEHQGCWSVERHGYLQDLRRHMMVINVSVVMITPWSMTIICCAGWAGHLHCSNDSLPGPCLTIICCDIEQDVPSVVMIASLVHIWLLFVMPIEHFTSIVVIITLQVHLYYLLCPIEQDVSSVVMISLFLLFFVRKWAGRLQPLTLGLLDTWHLQPYFYIPIGTGWVMWAIKARHLYFPRMFFQYLFSVGWPRSKVDLTVSLCPPQHK